MNLPSSLEDDASTRLNRPQVSVAVDSNSDSLEQYVSKQIDGTIAVSPYLNAESNKTTLAGLPAYSVVYTDPGGGRKGIELYTMTDDGTVYEIHYTSHASNFDTYLPIAQKIMDSFRIIDGGAGEGGEQEDEEDENN